MSTLLGVAIAAAATALATGLGALPFLVRRDIPSSWLGGANALAAGVMVGASIGLIGEGLSAQPTTALAGAAAGGAFVLLVRRSLPEGDGMRFQGLRADGAQQAILIMVVMTAHSAAEGIGVGVAYGGGAELGAATAAAIAVHNIPEGLAIALVLVPRGVGVGRAAAWSIVSSLPQPILAVPAFLLVDVFEPILPVGLGFAAGAMLWMSFAELAPEARRRLPLARVAALGVAACAGMILLQTFVFGL